MKNVSTQCRLLMNYLSNTCVLPVCNTHYLYIYILTIPGFQRLFYSQVVILRICDDESVKFYFACLLSSLSLLLHLPFSDP